MEDNKGEVITEVAGDEPENPEVNTPEEPAQEPAKSQHEIELETELAKWQNEAKAHQRTASKKAEEAQRWQSEVAGLNNKYAILDTKFDALLDHLDSQAASQIDTDEYGEQPRKPQQRPSLKETVASKTKSLKTPEQMAQETHFKEVSDEIMAIQKEIGIDFKESENPEEERVYTLFVSGNPDKALKIARGLKEKMAEANNGNKVNPVEDERDKKIKELEAEIERQKKIQSGELISEKGQPSGAALQFRQIEEKYVKGQISKEEYGEARRKQGLY